MMGGGDPEAAAGEVEAPCEGLGIEAVDVLQRHLGEQGRRVDGHPLGQRLVHRVGQVGGGLLHLVLGNHEVVLRLLEAHPLLQHLALGRAAESEIRLGAIELRGRLVAGLHGHLAQPYVAQQVVVGRGHVLDHQLPRIGPVDGGRLAVGLGRADAVDVGQAVEEREVGRAADVLARRLHPHVVDHHVHHLLLGQEEGVAAGVDVGHVDQIVDGFLQVEVGPVGLAPRRRHAQIGQQGAPGRLDVLAGDLALEVADAQAGAALQRDAHAVLQGEHGRGRLLRGRQDRQAQAADERGKDTERNGAMAHGTRLLDSTGTGGTAAAVTGILRT
ncbi:MAG: hypothetical protein R3D98_14050 [Candidatus Krumholzibacteriia bacterium]